MDADTRLKTEEKIIAMLKTVYDPEIPVNIYDLGLIYKIDLQDDGEVVLDMTLTAPNCPAADFIMEDVRQKVDSVEGVTSSVVNLVFEPEWDMTARSQPATFRAKSRQGIIFATPSQPPAAQNSLSRSHAGITLIQSRRNHYECKIIDLNH